jgi:hypothetical protein
MDADQLYDKIEKEAFRDDITYQPFCHQILNYIRENGNSPKQPIALGVLLPFTKKDFHRISSKDIRRICAKFFSDRELLRFFFQSLNQTTQKIITRMCFTGSVPYNTAKEINGGQHLLANTKDFWGRDMLLHKDLRYLQFYLKFGYQSGRANYHDESLEGVIEALQLCFVLPEYIRAAFIEILPKPKEYILQPYTLPENWHVQSFEKTVFEEFPNILLLLKQGTIKSTQEGLITISSIRGIQKRLALKPFFNDSGYTKGLFLAGFAGDKSMLSQMNSPLDMIREIFNGKRYYPMIDALMFYFGGIRKIEHHYFRGFILREFFNLLKELPEDHWITRENLLFYANAHYFDMDLLTTASFQKLKEPTEAMDGGLFKNASIQQQQQIIREQLIISTILGAAAFGLVELAYDPEDPSITADPKVLHSGRFSACKMTALGTHILLGKAGYVVPDSAAPIRFELSETALEIEVTGNMDVAVSLLGNWFIPTKNNRLVFDKNRIIDRCRNIYDFEEEIGNFNKALGRDLPDFWKLSLVKMVRETGALKSLQDTLVLRLSPHDKQLLRLIAQDNILKENCLKAEKYIIIVLAENIPLFTKRIATLGYLIEPTLFDSLELTSFKKSSLHPQIDINEYNITIRPKL